VYFYVNRYAGHTLKVNLSLCLTKHHAMKDVLGEWRYSSIHSLTSALDGEAPRTHWIGGWVGSRADLDAVVKKKIPSPSRDSNLRSSSP